MCPERGVEGFLQSHPPAVRRRPASRHADNSRRFHRWIRFRTECRGFLPSIWHLRWNRQMSTGQHTYAEHVFRTHRIGRNDGGQGGIDPTTQADYNPLKSAFANIISRTQHERGICFRFLALFLLVDFARESAGIEVDEVFLEGPAPGNHLSSSIEYETGTI